MPVAAWFQLRGWDRERTLFALHRLTGWAILAFLVVHIVFVHEIAEGQGAWSYVNGLDSGPIGDAFFLLVGAALLFHTLNGVRIMLIEWQILTPKATRAGYGPEVWLRGRRHRWYVTGMFAVGIVLLLWAGWILFT